MRICTRCFREFDEKELRDSTLASEIADIFLCDFGTEDIHDLCPQCREELGVIFLAGFDQ